jgi:N-acetylglutamate synthase-like GNAT family acetyltransferase
MTKEIRIVDYEPSHKKRFIEINEAWITRNHVIEDIDREELHNLENSILKPGGAILIALADNEVVGTAALVKMNNDTFELIKMAVDEKFRGHGIGRRLCVRSLDKAKSLGAKKVILHSNTKGSATAVKLYYELGFKKIPLGKSEFQRADIKMEIEL